MTPFNTLLKITDRSGELTITFYRDGTFKAKTNYGDYASGKFSKNANGSVVLNGYDCSGKIEITTETGNFVLEFHADWGLAPYYFDLTEEEMDLLIMIR